MNTERPIRLDRLLANLGYATRAAARALLEEGRVYINGAPEKNGARTIPAQDFDTIRVDGEALDHPDGIFVLLHKPAGYACSHNPKEAPLVYDLLPARWMRRNPQPESIGRLDRDTTGLLLITDRLDLVHRLASPKHALEKVYLAEVEKTGPELDASLTALFAGGSIRLDGEDKPCLPARLVITGKRQARLTLHEGRFHQVKRMFAACGYKVCALHRESFGPYTLEGLEEGQYKTQTPPRGSGRE